MSEQVSKTQWRVEEEERRLVQVMGEEDVPGDLEVESGASVRSGDHRDEGLVVS